MIIYNLTNHKLSLLTENVCEEITTGDIVSRTHGPRPALTPCTYICCAEYFIKLSVLAYPGKPLYKLRQERKNVKMGSDKVKYNIYIKVE